MVVIVYSKCSVSVMIEWIFKSLHFVFTYMLHSMSPFLELYYTHLIYGCIITFYILLANGMISIPQLQVSKHANTEARLLFI